MTSHPDTRAERQRRGPAWRGTELPAAVRTVVVERDGYACVCCGTSIIGELNGIHFRKPEHLGGTASPENLITVLRACGERIRSRLDPADTDKGYTVASADDPAVIPVMLATKAGQETMWLTPDGSLSLEPPRSSTLYQL